MASINSSILGYRNINGRKYQSSKTTEYWAPTDEKHIKGLDVSNRFTLMLMEDKLFQAPITEKPPENPPCRDRHRHLGHVRSHRPLSRLTSPPTHDQRHGRRIPLRLRPRLRHLSRAAQLGAAQLQLPDRRRAAGLNLPARRLRPRAHAHARPGGWAESTEIDLETRSENPRVAEDSSHIFKKWRDLFWQAGDRIGRTFKIARDGKMERGMRDAGFVDAQHRQWKLPIGGWPQDPKLKQVGLHNVMFIDQSLDGFAVFPIGEILGWTFEEVTVLVSQMRLAIKDPKALPYYNV
ncbi:hypothetical protein AK830_g8276 [Neonectria ditissima]|uniref:Uncharacterized protein n=1 Tax=Neonectria ditissima TaxID=78410 RepID=A0A0N8H689_9HYPO|nr:hypothetical protein AK830_g8276 [Neonectria ditissima]